MRVLYGIVGEGMGHATRSRVVLDHLVANGHDIMVVVSGRAYKFLNDVYGEEENVSIQEIHGLNLAYKGNAMSLRRSFELNLKRAPAGIQRNYSAYKKVVGRFTADVVISDFDSWAYFYGKRHGVPVISIDNMQILNRCQHDSYVTNGGSMSFRMAKAAVKMKMPGAEHYLVSSFFQPPVHKGRTTLVPPILRPEILNAKREPGEHVLVYQTQAANAELIRGLREMPYEFRVYGLGRDEQVGNIKFCPFSQDGFIDDLRTAKAVVAGGGYSLMGEAVHLRVPMLSMPLKGQYEQQLNARYLDKLGYGMYVPGALDLKTLEKFLKNTPQYELALSRYRPQDNRKLFQRLDTLLDKVHQRRAFTYAA
ncbi:MAG: glycosyltransferase family protein [Planctomycetota bacterium]|nr:glycosyltransferase family protein [Planctomycetota bacterium]